MCLTTLDDDINKNKSDMKGEENKLPESTVPADIRWDIMYTMRQIILSAGFGKRF